MSISNPNMRHCLADNLKQIRATIAAACTRAHRHPEDVNLLVVTKSVGIDVIRQLLELGVTDLGESRVQELTQRAAMVEEGFSRRSLGGASVPIVRPRWHLVGHLQRNKVRAALPWSEMIHSVDSLRLGEELDAAASRANRPANILIQVNSADETGKFGVAIGAVTHLAEQFHSLPNLSLRGLMCMAPIGVDDARLRGVFGRTRELFEEMRHKHAVGTAFDTLSMGMSDDYETAVECGSTLVRIGRAMFVGLNSDDAHEGAESAEVASDSTSPGGR